MYEYMYVHCIPRVFPPPAKLHPRIKVDNALKAARDGHHSVPELVECELNPDTWVGAIDFHYEVTPFFQMT